MQIKTNGITIEISDSDFLSMLSDDDKVDLIEIMSCEDVVIKHVFDQISQLNGMTENGFSGSSRCGGSRLTGEGTVLDIARMWVAKSANVIANDVIEAQASAMKGLREENNNLRERIRKWEGSDYEEHITLEGEVTLVKCR